MIKIYKHILAAALIQSIGLSSVSFAEEKSISIFDSLKKIQKPIEERDDFTELLNNAKNMQERDNLGLDEKTAQTVNKLKNPFIPRLPQKEKPPAPVDEKPLPPPPTGIPQNPLPPIEQLPPPPVAIPTPSGPELKISGLVWNTAKPQAIINGQVVSVGDTVNNWIITGISKTGVEIRNGEQTITVEKKAFTQESNDSSSTRGDQLGSRSLSPRESTPARSTPRNQTQPPEKRR